MNFFDEPEHASVLGAPEIKYDISAAVAIAPIPFNISLNPDKVLLGKLLFYDPRLSGDNSVSCASCHNLATGGTIRTAKVVGINNQLSTRNSPTLFNSAFNFTQLWDGKFNTLEQQIEAVILSPSVMGSDWLSVLDKLKQDPEYVKAFALIYEDVINKKSVKDAIATFERSLITPNSRFDQYLRGDTNALTAQEEEGYQLFSSLGCISCHQGINIGGNLFQKIGLFKDYKSNADVDLGRFGVTGDENDRHVFKVPSLRNVAQTAPYFHDGTVKTLEDAIKLMADYQLGREISAAETTKISAFLKTLSGTYLGEAL
ncbi:MAG: cytochrome-c peroxidase [Oceanospirillaceae bacterium]